MRTGYLTITIGRDWDLTRPVDQTLILVDFLKLIDTDLNVA